MRHVTRERALDDQFEGRRFCSIGDVLPFVGPVINAITGSDSNSQAQQGYRQAGDTTLQMFQQGQANVAPYIDAGKNALADYLKLAGITGQGLDMKAPGAAPYSYDQFTADPSYGFIKQQQQDALMNQKSSLGGVQSGNTLRALTDYATGAASTEYGNAFGRWRTYMNDLFGRVNTVAGTGANAGMGIAGIGQTAASNIGSSQIGAAQYGGAGTQAVGNALSQIPQLLARQGGGGGGYGGYGGYGGEDAGSLAGSSSMFDTSGNVVPII